MGKLVRLSSERVSPYGQQIISFLRKTGNNQAWLAEQCGVTPPMINHVISGRAMPSLSLAKRICKALNCRIDDVFGGET